MAIGYSLLCSRVLSITIFSLSSSPSHTHTHTHTHTHFRSNGSILHNLIVSTQRPNAGYSLNNVAAPVLYKLIHYYMENPINGTTVLKYPVDDRDVSATKNKFEPFTNSRYVIEVSIRLYMGV